MLHVVAEGAVVGVVGGGAAALDLEILARFRDLGHLVQGKVDERELVRLEGLECRLQQLLVLHGLFAEPRGHSHGVGEGGLRLVDDFADLLLGMVDPYRAVLVVPLVQLVRFHVEPQEHVLVLHVLYVGHETFGHVERGHQQGERVFELVQGDDLFRGQFRYLERDGQYGCVGAEHVLRNLQFQVQRVAFGLEYLEFCRLEDVRVVVQFLHVQDVPAPGLDEPLRLQQVDDDGAALAECPDVEVLLLVEPGAQHLEFALETVGEGEGVQRVDFGGCIFGDDAFREPLLAKIRLGQEIHNGRNYSADNK